MPGARRDITAGRAFVELYVKNSRFMRGLRAAQARMSQFGADMTAVGRKMATASAAMLIPLAAGAKTFADFDDAMRQVKAVSGATGEDFARLTESAKELGRTTSFTAVEVAGLMAELGRAGFDASQIDAMTGSVLDLARATGTEAPQAAGIMSSSIRQFGLEATDAQRVADGLTAAANKSFNTVEQLGEALGLAGPVANDFNMSFEDTLAVLGGLGNMGIQASSAGTTMRRLLTITGAEAKKLQGIFGVSFVDAAGNARPLVDTLGDINESTKDLGTAARAQKFNEAFGLLGITGASSIGRAAGDIRELAGEIKAAGGIAADTAAEMDAGLGGAFRRIQSAFEGAKIAIGEAIEKGLTPIVEAGSAVLGTITKLIEENQDLVKAFGKWAVIIGGAGVALMGIGMAATIASTAVGGIMSVIMGLTTVFGFLLSTILTVTAVVTSPFTLIAVAIAGVTAATLQATGALESLVGAGVTLGNRFNRVFGNIRETVAESFGGIRDAIKTGDLALAGEIAMSGLQLAVMQGMEGISQIIGGVWGDTLAKITSQLADGDFAGVWNTVVLGMSKVWNQFSAGIVNAFVGAARKVLETWHKTVNSITNFILNQARAEFERDGKGGVFAMLAGMDEDEFKRDKELGGKLKTTLKKNIETDIADIEQELKVAVAEGDQDQIDLLNQQLETAKKNLEDLDRVRVPDIFDEVEAGTFSGAGTQAVASAIDESLQSLEDQAKRNAQEADDALAAGVSGATDQASDRVDALQKKLDGLRANAAIKKFASGLDIGGTLSKLLGGGSEETGASGGVAGTPAEEQTGSGGKIAVASSAAELIAISMGAGTSNKDDGIVSAVEQSQDKTVSKLEAVEEVLSGTIFGALQSITTALKDNSLQHP